MITTTTTTPFSCFSITVLWNVIHSFLSRVVPQTIHSLIVYYRFPLIRRITGFQFHIFSRVSTINSFSCFGDFFLVNHLCNPLLPLKLPFFYTFFITLFIFLSSSSSSRTTFLLNLFHNPSLPLPHLSAYVFVSLSCYPLIFFFFSNHPSDAHDN